MVTLAVLALAHAGGASTPGHREPFVGAVVHRSAAAPIARDLGAGVVLGWRATRRFAVEVDVARFARSQAVDPTLPTAVRRSQATVSGVVSPLAGRLGWVGSDVDASGARDGLDLRWDVGLTAAVRLGPGARGRPGARPGDPPDPS